MVVWEEGEGNLTSYPIPESPRGGSSMMAFIFNFFQKIS
jgi:hypothetical protein